MFAWSRLKLRTIFKMELNSRGIVLNFKFFEEKACSTHSVYLAIIFKVKQITCLTSTNPNGFLTNVFLRILSLKLHQSVLLSICSQNNFEISSAANPICIFVGNKRFSSSNSLSNRSNDPVQSARILDFTTAWRSVFNNFWMFSFLNGTVGPSPS